MIIHHAKNQLDSSKRSRVIPSWKSTQRQRQRRRQRRRRHPFGKSGLNYSPRRNVFRRGQKSVPNSYNLIWHFKRVGFAKIYHEKIGLRNGANKSERYLRRFSSLSSQITTKSHSRANTRARTKTRGKRAQTNQRRRTLEHISSNLLTENQQPEKNSF